MFVYVSYAQIARTPPLVEVMQTIFRLLCHKSFISISKRFYRDVL